MARTIKTFLAILAACLLGTSAQAADFVVTNLADSGPGSLRQAVLDAGANDEPDAITFNGSLSGQIDLGDHISINEDLTITGFLGDPSRITIDGGGENRIFTLGCDGDTITIEGLTLTHGRTSPSRKNGGAIYSEVCNLILRNMVITNSVAVESRSGGLQEGNGGGVSIAGARLHVIDSTISNNVAGVDSDSVDQSTGLGGGIAAVEAQVEIVGSVISDNAAINVNPEGFVGGGGVGALDSSLVIQRSVISRNMAGNRSDAGDATVFAAGGGILAFCRGCAIEDSTGKLRIEDSTISGNHAGNSGTSGVDYSAGGGVYADTAVVANSTISGNRVGDLKGINSVSPIGGGLLLSPHDLGPHIIGFIESSTITDNQALGAQAVGGGIADVEGFVQLHNTIVAGNSAATGPDASGFFESSYSIIEDQSDVVFNSGSAIAGSPNLGPLTDNGGPTETHAITNTSLAFNAGDPLDCPETDQRGVDRPQLGVCDIGAFELATPPVGPTLTEIFDDLVGAGQLTGTGLGRSAARRLNAMRNMTIRSEALMEAGDRERACEVLFSALLKTDGQSPPPDFVQGPGAAALAAAIEEVQGDNCI